MNNEGNNTNYVGLGDVDFDPEEMQESVNYVKRLSECQHSPDIIQLYTGYNMDFIEGVLHLGIFAPNRAENVQYNESDFAPF